MASQRQIIGIQYLRGVAALAVVLSHADTNTAFPKYFGERTFDGLLYYGVLGVPLFFLISGFIITIVSLEPGTTAPKLSVGDFAARRALRILPVMWIAIVSYAALQALGRGEVDAAAVLRSLVIWPVGDLAPNVIWTLRSEAIFYTLFALTFLGPRGLRWLLPLWFVSPLLYALTTTPPPATQGWSGLGWTLFHPVCLQFGMGLGLGLIWLKWSRNLTVRVPLLWPICIVYFVAVTVGFHLFPPHTRLMRDLAAGLALLPLVALAAHATDRPSRIGLLLGDASFSIYLFHSAAISGMLTGLAAFAPAMPAPAAMILAFLAGAGFGLAAYFAVEKPLLAGLRTFMAKRRGARPPVRSADAW